ncbi:putative amidohydrolase YtcJ [Kibdelosporangium banguiense]|uniref:Amidohydrolase YtcJ n=1 Tax=Kibdelosporangium banguiense TaxID=1365924 RepID=A0ABS4TQR5_9PSEU|nr:amidohydrolase family protein [Kibdelosporangium banguiense]MBP2326216.1 putative amidohydrolase YtcJ [Kibdelosporangium banguiense]
MRMLLMGGRIHVPNSPDATAMAVEDGTVVWVGQDGPARTLYPDAEIVQLDGAFVAPAFVDPHVHATSAGLLLTGLDLTGCTSLAECLDALRKAEGDAVWGHGWDETVWPERRPPTRAEIDAAAGGRAVYLSRIDVHSALVSSATVDRAPDSRGADGWDDDGPLSRDAHHRVRRVALRELSAEQRTAAKLAFLQHVASRGVASVHECAGPEISSKADLAEILELGRDDARPDVVGYWGEAGAYELARELGIQGLAGDLFVDGAIGSRTAALHEPYTDDPANRGARYLDAGEIAEHLAGCTNAGLQAGFHVIGDAAVSAVIDGFAKAEASVGRAALAAARHRLEHVEMVTAGQAAQLASWGVVASMQPMFDAAWGGPDGMYVQRLGERGTQLNPFSALARSGVVLAFGSDAPVTPVDPWRSVQAAVHHRTEGFGVSPRAAFTAHTRSGWRAAGVDDGVTGMLTPGAPATYAVWETGDLVVAGSDSRVQRWSTDPRSGVPGLPSLEPDAVLPRCLRTVLRGKTIYEER